LAQNPDPADPLDDIRPQLKRALELTDADFDRMAPEVKNLLTVRRKLGHTWLDDFEVVVEVLEKKGCGCGVEAGQIVVFDMRHRIKPEKSNATLCMHMLAPVLAIFYMTFDRGSEGLNPLTRIWRFYDCVAQAEDEGAGKARTRVYLRTSDTHQPVLVEDMKPRRELAL
jgi:uncharacterized repeat protein (TIGR04076 family)